MNKAAPKPATDLNAERPVAADDKFVLPTDRKTTRPPGSKVNHPGDESNWL